MESKLYERILIAAAIIALGTLVFVNIVYAAPTACQIGNGCTGTSTPPAYGNLLIGGKNGEYEYVASSTFGGGGTGSGFSTTSANYWFTQQTTSGLVEGSNLYFTNARALTALTGQNVSIFTNDAGYITPSVFNSDFDTRLTATTSLPKITTLAGLSLPYSQLTGTPDLTQYLKLSDWFGTTTDQLKEGSTNLYFTNARADARFVIDLAATTSVKSITTLPSLSLPYTQLTGTPAIASSTLLSDSNTFSGVNSFTNSSSNFGGTWQTFSPSHFQTTLSFPLSYSNGGTGTSTPANYGNVLAWNGSGYQAIATSTFNLTTSAFKSSNISQWTNDAGYLTSLAGAASSTLLSDNNTFSGNDTFNSTITGSISGNAGTATKLQSARTINGVSFDGSGNITINAASSTILADNSTFTGRDTFSLINLSATSSAVLATDASGNVVSTTSIGTNYITGTLGSINGTSLTRGGSITVNAASSTLLADHNTFSASTTFQGQLNLQGASSTLTSVSNLWDSALTSGDCVQAGAGGLLTSTASACGSASGITALGNYATTTGTAISLSSSTASFNGLTFGQTIVASANALLFTPTISGTLGNAGLAHSTIVLNGTTLTLGDAGDTITAASSTLLSDHNIFSASTTMQAQLNLQGASSTVFSAANIWDSALTSGDCVQAGTNGLLTSAASACGSGGGGSDPFTHPATNQSATTSLLLFFGNASSTEFEATSSVWLDATKNAVLGTDGNGLVSATTSIGANYISGVLGTINGASFSRGGTITINAASSTLLSDKNTWTGLQSLSNASSSLLSVTAQAWFGGTATSTFTSSGTLLVGTTTPTTAAALYVSATSSQPQTNVIFNIASTTGASLFNVNGAGTITVTGLNNSVLAVNGSGAIIASSTIGWNLIKGQASSIFAFDASGNPTATTSIGINYLSANTISGVTLGNNLFSHSHDSTLNGTSYNGSAAVSDWGLNLSNANTWTGKQTFTNASSSLFSVTGQAWFGGTATSTFTPSGTLLVGTTTPSTSAALYVSATSSQVKTNTVFNVASTTGSSLFNINGNGDITTQLGNALVLSGGAGSTLSTYGGSSCTNQFPRSVNALGAWTCATVQNTDLAHSTIVVNSTTLTLGDSADTITAASSTLLANNNTFSGTDNFSGTLQIGGTALSLPVSIANGGTNNTSGGTTNAISYFDGTRYNNSSLLEYTSGTGAMTLGTSTASFGLLTLGTSTQPQLQLSDNTAGDNNWFERWVGHMFYMGTSTVSATSTGQAALSFDASQSGGSLSVGSSTPTFTANNGLITVGTKTGGASTTISTGQIQIDGYNTAGSRVCVYVVGTTLTVGSGACTQ